MGHFDNAIRDELCFVVGAIAGEPDDLVSATELGEKVLSFAIKVVTDDSIRSVQNVLSRAIVLFQQNDFGARKITLKFRDVANIGTPESVNRLIGITHHRQRCSRQTAIFSSRDRRGFGNQRRGNLPGQFANQGILRVVCVLVLIHQHMPKACLIGRGHFGEGPKQIHSLAN